MTFGEKIRRARLSKKYSQSELAARTGISERSLYTYEQSGVLPRSGNVKKLAEVLGVSVSYLLDDSETNERKDLDRDMFFQNVENNYGRRGVYEASDLLDRASALFAGGELDEEAKDMFFQSLMEVYLESKAEAREKYSPKFRKKR